MRQSTQNPTSKPKRDAEQSPKAGPADCIAFGLVKHGDGYSLVTLRVDGGAVSQTLGEPAPKAVAIEQLKLALQRQVISKLA